ncbi:MAG: hypothetical protein OES13_00345 [Acidimicrobiia bacterium]|nr:hypothetical protein [Acidimicrobiia bacterium]
MTDESVRHAISEIIIEDHPSGLCCEHTMPCAICLDEKAVHNMNTRIFAPCWSCQDHGWMTIRVPAWVARLFGGQLEQWRRRPRR